MDQLPKRYVFIDYSSLRKIKFSKLEKICNKVFIFINNQEETIPAHIVLQAQHLGKRVKWISTDISEGTGFMLHISFLIGALHQKTKKSIEFAILSDDSDYDSLVHFINDTGRNCLRVKIDNEDPDELDEEDLLQGILIEDAFDGDEPQPHTPEPLRKFKSA